MKTKITLLLAALASSAALLPSTSDAGFVISIGDRPAYYAHRAYINDPHWVWVPGHPSRHNPAVWVKGHWRAVR